MYACVYYLLRSIASSLLLRLQISSACFYNKKKIFFNIVLTLNANFLYYWPCSFFILHYISLRLLYKTMKNLNSKVDNDTWRHFYISSGSPINKQNTSALQSIISTLDLYRAQNTMPFTIAMCKLFRIKSTTVLEGETFLRNKDKFAFFLNKVHFFW